MIVIVTSAAISLQTGHGLRAAHGSRADALLDDAARRAEALATGPPAASAARMLTRHWLSRCTWCVGSHAAPSLVVSLHLVCRLAPISSLVDTKYR